MRNNNSDTFNALLNSGDLPIKRGAIFDTSPPRLPGNFSFDRVEGMMLALAIGDALGKTTESMLPGARRERYGEIRYYLPVWFEGNKSIGLPSDDTQLAFWTLEQMLKDRGVVPDHIAQIFCSRRIYGIGSSVRAFIRNYKAGVNPWWNCAPPSAGNGALMRIAPAVIPHLQTRDPALWADTALLALITHKDSASVATCVAFINMVWRLFTMEEAPDPAWWIDELTGTLKELETYNEYKPRGGLNQNFVGPLWLYLEQHVKPLLDKGLSVMEACRYWYSGAFLLETVPSAIYILAKHGHDPEEAIIRAVNDTKDNDTIAAIVGAAVGALHGKKALPKRWLLGLTGRTTEQDDGKVFQLLEAAEKQFFTQSE